VHTPLLSLLLSILFRGLDPTHLLLIRLFFQSTSTNTLQPKSEALSSLGEGLHLPGECLGGILTLRLLIVVLVELEHEVVEVRVESRVGCQSGLAGRFEGLQGVLAELSVLG